jgi:hypothetical protein
MNCKLFKFCWIPILLFFLNSYSFAQKNNQPATDSSQIPAEDSISSNYEDVADTLVVKTVFGSAGDSLLQWKQGREFDYMIYLDSLLRKQKGLRIDTVSIDKGMIHRSRPTTDTATGNNSNSLLNSFPVKIFFWAIAVFFIGFILYKLFFTGDLFATGNIKAADEPANKEPESLSEYSKYNVLIHEAELKNDFSLSVRYLYLQSLRRLADNELIVFSTDKTNNLYVRELEGRSYQQEFAFLTRNYEYIWYGKFAIDITRYQKLKTEFIVFNKKI